MNNNSQQGSQGTGADIVGAIIEALTELVKIVFELLWTLLKRLLNKRPPLERIDPKLLSSRKKSTRPESLGRSLNSRRDLLFKKIDFDKHTFIVGAAGFGKTNLLSLLQEHDLQEDRPIIFFDPKGDLEALTTFKEICERYKRECLIFSEHYPGSIKLNPLKQGSVGQIVEQIMGSFDWDNSFYKDLAYSTLSEIILELKMKAEIVSFKNILAVLNKCDEKNLEKILGLKVKLTKIVTSDFAPLLDDDGKAWTFDLIRQKRACLYIGLSTQGYGETAMALGKVFLSELLFHSYQTLLKAEDSHASMAQAISVYFDEVGSLITPRFIELQNKCRGAGIRLSFACQSVADIDRVSPELTKQVIENAANLFIFKQRVESSTKFLAESIGTVPVMKQTFQTESDQKSGRGSLREANELIVHPDMIKNLRVGQCVLVRHNPSRVDLLNLRERSRPQISKPMVPKIETTSKEIQECSNSLSLIPDASKSSTL